MSSAFAHSPPFFSNIFYCLALFLHRVGAYRAAACQAQQYPHPFRKSGIATVQLSPDSFCRACRWTAQRACPRGEACAAAFYIAGGQNPFRSAFPQIYIPVKAPHCTLPQAAALRSVPCLKREHSRIASLRDVPFFRFYAFFCSSDILQRITSLIIARVRNCRLRNGYTGYYFVFMLYAFLYT